MVNNAIKKLNDLRNVSFVQVSKYIYEGIVPFNGRSIKMQLDFSTGFPEHFPYVILPEHKGFRPHISSDGKMCLFDEDNIIIQSNMPDQLVIDAFDRAIEILNMDSQTQNAEAYREFQVYWASKSKCKYKIHLNLPEADAHEFKEYIAVGSETRNILLISSSVEESERILLNDLRFDTHSNQVFHIPCTRIRLRESAFPPMRGEITWKDFKDYIFRNITVGQRRHFKQFLSTRPTHIKRFILVQIPSQYGDQFACVLLTCHNTNHMSINNSLGSKIDPVISFRVDQQYLLKRIGAEIDLTDKTVLLVGCGSIGGFIAENLCQCGVGTVDILDKDLLSFDNIHRHVLGFDSAINGGYKADLLKKHLENKYPYVDIDALNLQNRSAESFFNEADRLSCYDLIISATGNPSTNLMINEKIKLTGAGLPFIVCFNEPYGIGGHAIAIMPEGACLRCMYSDVISGELSLFQGSLVKEGQSFSKTLSACTGSYVEYSVLDIQQTGIMTTRLAIDLLKGNCSKSRLDSWLGDSKKLIEAGFEASEYYNELQSSGSLFVSKDIPSYQRCILCGK